MNRIKVLLWIIALIILCQNLVDASPPRTFSGRAYYGEILDSTEHPIPDSIYEFTFSLYDSSEGGNIVWTSGKQNVGVDNGLYRYPLGGDSDRNAKLFRGDYKYYLEISTSAIVDSMPRELICPSMHTSILGGLGNRVSGDLALACGGWRNTVSGLGCMVAGGNYNTAESHLATVVGGNGNKSFGGECTIVGGSGNSAGGFNSSIVGGWRNSTGSHFSSVGGGGENQAINSWTTVCGGTYNLANQSYATICGGAKNTSNGYASTICGGKWNTASGRNSTVCGGFANVAKGDESTVCGGEKNSANGRFSTVAGGVVNSVAGNYSAIPGGVGDTLTENASYSMAFGASVYLNTPMRVGLYSSLHFGMLGINRDDRDGGILHPIHVGTNERNGSGAYLTSGGVWTDGIDTNSIKSISNLESNGLLENISDIPVEIWSYKLSGERHIRPAANDFINSFDVGVLREDKMREKRYLAPGDVAGVVFAGLKELIKENSVLKQNIKDSNLEIEELKNQIEDIKNSLEIVLTKGKN